jgi:hemerythrin-like domain-containing protein
MKSDALDKPTPNGSFEVPLEMLRACHARIEDQCSTLRRLVPHLHRHGADDEARLAAANVMRYFDTAARDHHDDEEVDLFPALIESMAGSDAVCLRELTAGLAAEHRLLEAAWQRVRTSLERVVAGKPESFDVAGVSTLVDLYERHIQREDNELLPMAQRLLSDGQLEQLGRAMRERRGIDPIG